MGWKFKDLGYLGIGIYRFRVFRVRDGRGFRESGYLGLGIQWVGI